MATDKRKRAVEARCHCLDSALEEIRQKTSALLDEKRRLVAASENPAARPKDESETKASRVSGLVLIEHICFSCDSESHEKKTLSRHSNTNFRDPDRGGGGGLLKPTKIANLR